jgi:putative peptide zinc metalloprotease protein
MAESFFSPSWYRVSKLQPRLRAHAQIHRHYYGEELWYVLQDHARGRYYRFTPLVFQIIGMMDGRITVQELWEKAVERSGDNAPSQGDMVQILGQLHAADVLQCDVPPDAAELFHRYEQGEQRKWMMNLRSPLSMRFPLFDPERFISRSLKVVRPFFSVYGAALWVAVVTTAVVAAGIHWQELTRNISDRVLSAQNLLLLWAVYPFVKALHELGHGYAVKRWGGEVHEVGIILLVLTPMPYIDASSASAFPEKWRRALVGGAGMMAELFLASLSLFLWLNLEPGVARSIAFNVVLIASVSTLVFNGNPLLRYDGYYILSDLLEIPNLAQRSNQYVGYIFKRYLLGLEKIEPPYTGPGERLWLAVYSTASFIYRMFVYAAIILFIAGKFFFIGVLLGIWAVVSMVILPVIKKVHFVIFSPLVREKRGRALVASGAIGAGVIMLLFLVPFPLWTRAEGTIWVPEESLVRARVDGVVSSIEALHDRPAKKGDVLIECTDPFLVADVKVLRAQLKSLEAQYNAEIYTNRAKAQVTKEEIAPVRSNLARAEERLRELTIYSPRDGVFILPGAEDLPGRYLKQGDLIGYVLGQNEATVRVVVPQASVDLIRHRTKAIRIRMAEHLDRVYPAILQREVPAAADRLPSAVLGSAGGGEIAVDPSDSKGVKTIEKLFQFDIRLPLKVDNINIGGRVYVRFDHGYEPLGFQWYRSLRRLFLRRFNV